MCIRDSGLPSKLAAPVGAAAGLILGMVAALILGVRRRRVRHVRDVAAVGPDIRVYDEKTIDSGLLRIAARCAKVDKPLVAVLALPGSEDALMSVFPHDRFKVSCTSADKAGRFSQFYSVEISPETWKREISDARTFCFFEEIEYLIKNLSLIHI